MNLYSFFIEIDLSNVGLDGVHCSKRYNIPMITALANALAKKDYGPKENLEYREMVRNIIALALGSHKTELRKARKDCKAVNFDKLKKIFEAYIDLPSGDPKRLNSGQIFCTIIDYLANVVRSSAANFKSTTQKDRVREIVKGFTDPRLQRLQIKEVILKEFKNNKKRQRPDGILEKPGSDTILAYLRYGSGAGGSQGDRRSTFMSLPSALPKYKFLFIWDGTEVVDDVIEQVNQAFPGRVYITRTKDLDEQQLCALYDS